MTILHCVDLWILIFLFEGWSDHRQEWWSNNELWEGKLNKYRLTGTCFCKSCEQVIGSQTISSIGCFFLAGSVDWPKHYDIYGWVRNSPKNKIWLYQTEQAGTWYAAYWPRKTRDVCCSCSHVGKKGWKKSFDICGKGSHLLALCFMEAHLPSNFLTTFSFSSEPSSWW